VTALQDSGWDSDDLGAEANDAKIRDTRVTCVLAAGLLTSFAIIDVWAIPSAIAVVWSIRAASVALILGIYALTRRAVFVTRYAPIVVTMYATIGLSINAMIYLSGPDEFARDLYYVGLILVIMGLFTWVHLRVIFTGLIAAGMIALYATIMTLHHGYHEADRLPLLLGYLFFLISSTVIGSMSQRLRVRYAKENRHLRLSLQQELENKERARRQSEFEAQHDPLTGLPNRTQLEQRVTEMLERARARRTVLALLFIDLDGFKPVNDTHGHLIGDEVLKLLARRLHNSLRNSDIIARLGGDEFVAVVQLDGRRTSIADNLAAKLARSIAEPIIIDQQTFAITASIGIALFPRDGDDLAGLLATADSHMYEAKRAGKPKSGTVLAITR
jgi:diguanylate cyclase (GGDEF)-like protein